MRPAEFIAQRESRPGERDLFVRVAAMAAANARHGEVTCGVRELEGDGDAGGAAHFQVELTLQAIGLRRRVKRDPEPC
jgi:hypothetical protein